MLPIGFHIRNFNNITFEYGNNFYLSTHNSNITRKWIVIGNYESQFGGLLDHCQHYLGLIHKKNTHYNKVYFLLKLIVRKNIISSIFYTNAHTVNINSPGESDNNFQ